MARRKDGSPETPHDFKNPGEKVHRNEDGIAGVSAYVPAEVYEMFYQKIHNRNPSVTKGLINRFLNRAVMMYLSEGIPTAEEFIRDKYKAVRKEHYLDAVC